jgi:hypothetical protein
MLAGLGLLDKALGDAVAAVDSGLEGVEDDVIGVIDGAEELVDGTLLCHGATSLTN